MDPKSLIPSLDAIVKDFEFNGGTNSLVRKARINGVLVNLTTKEGAVAVKELIA